MSEPENEPENRGEEPPASEADDGQLGVTSSSPALVQKMRQRRQRWEWNGRLALVTVAVGLVVLVLSAISYRYNSAAAATTYRSRAESARSDGNFAEQAKWLQRYSLMEPDDLDVVVELAIAADSAVDVAPRERRLATIDAARQYLSGSIARLGSSNPEATADLRRRLIGRLLQLRGSWLREAERQVIILQADPSDPEATKWLALALIGQINGGVYQDRVAGQFDQQADHWNWLASQKVGDVLGHALDQIPDDVDLIASFLGALETQPEIFTTAADQDPRAQRSVASIQTNQDGRSTLILYRYDLWQSREDEANERLFAAAPGASERTANLDPSKQAESPSAKPGNDERPDFYWDFILLLEAAGKIASQDPEQAGKWYQQLMELKIRGSSQAMAENVFLSAGRLKLVADDRDAAIQIWQRGLDQVNPDSLDLHGSIAALRVDDGSDDQASEAVSRFREATLLAAKRLSQLPEGQVSRADRSALSRRIQTAKWRLDVLHASVATREGKQLEAINRLGAALNASADIEAAERLLVARRLAMLYGREGSWDQAAAALDRAIELAPDNDELRAQAADAWRRSGDLDQSMDQWRVAGRSDSIAMQIASSEALLNYQLRQLPGQRDFSGVRAAMRRIRNLLVTAAENADANDPDPDALAPITQAATRLDILDISVPPVGVTAEENLQSPKLADRIVQLAAKYPDDGSVQAFAAERLAAVGRDEKSKEALSRLESIDPTNVSFLAIVKARIDAIGGDPLAACKRLSTQAKSDETGAVELLQIAAAYAAQGKDLELAYQTLLEISEDRLTLTLLFDLARIAGRLPEDSSLLTSADPPITPQALSIRWEDKLRDREGDQGSYWQYLKAARIIGQLQTDSGSLRDNDPRLAQARKLLRNVLSWRPRWGEAVSMGGYLSAIESQLAKDRAQQQSQSARAVEQLRRGIDAGDRRLLTKQQLWNQLILLNRFAEAEEVIRRASLSSESAIDKYGTAQIQLAQRRGEFQHGLDVAEAGIQQRPDDFRSYVVMCVTATVAAGNVETPEQKKSLFDRARTAIDKASEVADQDEPAVHSARLELELAVGDEPSIRQQITRIDQSGLEEYTKLMLTYRALMSINDFPAALPLLQRADELKPSSEVKVAMANLYRLQGRPDDQVTALRKALQQNSDDEQLRNNLAVALTVRDGENVDWDELARLLSSSDGATWGNRFAYAMLLARDGSDAHRNQAATILRELIQEQNDRSDDASRYLAVLLRTRVKDLGEDLSGEQESQRAKWLDEVSAIYQRLSKPGSPEVSDLYNYAVFLIDSADTEEDRAKVHSIMEKLQSMSNGSVASLEVGIRYADKVGESVTDFVQSWVDDAERDGVLDSASLKPTAGAMLFRTGFTDEGLTWFEKDYEENSERLRNYAAALINSKKFDKATEVSKQHYQKHADPESVVMMVESLLADKDAVIGTEHQEFITQAVEKFAKEATVLESVATLRLRQERYDDAIALYKQAQGLDPKSVRSLNNLAMALSEIPGRADEGLEPIDYALRLAAGVPQALPELLDTKGVVLLKAGRPAEAQKIFESAISRSDEPRYQFHLIVTLLALKKDSDAKEAWAVLDLEKLDPTGLTPNEQVNLETMKKDFGT